MTLERRVLELERRLAALEALPGGPLTGTWTPVFTGTGTAGAYTYSVQEGVYTRLGKLVYIKARLAITAIGTPPVGNMTITGLPYTCESAHSHAVCFGFISALDLTAGCVQLTGLVTGGTAVINLYESFDNAAGALYPAANFTNVNAQLYLTAWYRAA